MWPFSRKRDQVDYSELRSRILGEFEEMKQRMKLIEREHDDLHAAYRRLRGAKAQEARVSEAAPRPTETEEVPLKTRLRSQAQAILRGNFNKTE